MRSKTVETVPFVFRYFLVNRYTKEKFGPFDNIVDAKAFKYEKYRYIYWDGNSYADKLEFNHQERQNQWAHNILGRTKEVDRHAKKPFAILNHLGDVIDPKIVHEAGRGEWRNNRYERWRERGLISGARREFRKYNPNKLKMLYSTVKTVDSLGDIEYDETWMRSHYRRIRTTQERRMAIAHMDEYGAQMVRGKRRARTLPNAWDDYSSNVWDLKESWKHHSKRNKQYKTK